LDHLPDLDRVGGERPEFAAALQQAGLKHAWQMRHRLGPPLRQVFLTDLRKWKREIGDQSAVLAVSVVSGAEVVDPWRGVDVGGRFFAWDGPLEDLEDREPVGMPGDLQPDLMEALKKAGA